MIAPATFSADRAWHDLVAQCDFGPRNPGSDGHALALRYLQSELEGLTPRVRLDRFTGTEDGTPVHLTNLIADFGPKGPHPILLCAHWDTRPWADRDPDPNHRDTPILGADDGASGVAVALEVAREMRPKVPVRVVLFDGEDLGRDLATFFQGSRHYAANLGQDKPRWAILLDMVGQRDVRIQREALSAQSAPSLLDLVYADARALHDPAFDDRPGSLVYDDHLPLIEAGIPSIDLIDLDYPAWHTLKDTPDQCSRTSLSQVGQVVLDVVDQAD